jgi:hypothetical protein
VSKVLVWRVYVEVVACACSEVTLYMVFLYQLSTDMWYLIVMINVILALRVEDVLITQKQDVCVCV